MVERLEERTVLSVSATFDGQLLNISNSSDTDIVITVVNSNVKVNGLDPVRTPSQATPITAVQSISVADGSFANLIDLSAVNSSFTSLAAVSVNAGDGADTIKGTKFADLLDGGSGADSIDGGEGSDTIYGGLGNDTLDGGEGKNAPVDDIVFGGDGQDIIGGSSGHDIYIGGPGDDSISSDGGEGKVLVGGTGADLIKGASGNDLLLDGASPWETNLSATELKTIMAEWSTATDTNFNAIVDRIINPANTTGVNGTNHLIPPNFQGFTSNLVCDRRPESVARGGGWDGGVILQRTSVQRDRASENRGFTPSSLDPMARHKRCTLTWINGRRFAGGC